MQVISWKNENFTQKDISINVLAQNHSSKEIQIIMPKDSIMKEHIAPYDISVQLLQGELEFVVKDEKFLLKELDMICLEAKIPHSLKALQDSIVRLSLAKSDDVARVSKVLKL
ncbi:cupin [Campylobacter sp. MIT 99-7217]|uniref:cupin domain-containing protein n=1 Tax=Campylobacter sp. MIT 99-7217 TaxID=535091 RepID=UPI00115840CA|nr:cupin domain-containing protein [Campylobacter sp. MIT 99-7217]TQR29560.1 cupin [Campylobacter sp. MIT 99-7217]